MWRNVDHGRRPAGENFAPPLAHLAHPPELFFARHFFGTPCTFLAPPIIFVVRRPSLCQGKCYG